MDKKYKVSLLLYKTLVMKRETKLWIAIAALAVILLIVTQRGCSKSSTLEEYKTMNMHLDDSIKTFRKKDSSQVSSIAVLQSQSVNDFLTIRTANAEVQKLQKLVEENKKMVKGGGSVTTISGNTGIKTSIPTIVIPKDTAIEEHIIYLYPEYRSTFSLGKWVSGNTVSNRDTTMIDIRITDEYDVIVGRGKNPYAIVNSHSPYNTVTSVRTYQVSMPKPKKFSVGIQLGYGIYYTGKEVKPGPYIGVGISRNLINF